MLERLSNKKFAIASTDGNIQKTKNKAVQVINIKNNEEKIFVSVTSASLELKICITSISKICSKKYCNKTANSKKYGMTYK